MKRFAKVSLRAAVVKVTLQRANRGTPLSGWWATVENGSASSREWIGELCERPAEVVSRALSRWPDVRTIELADEEREEQH